jgi:uncharacterized protein (UPF0332 family)
LNDLAIILGRMLAKADQKLGVARRACDAGEWDEASSRAYYAAFHAVAAVLRQRGLTFSSHGQTLGSFNRECVRTGELPADFTKALTRLYRDRQVADYECINMVDEPTARQDLSDTERIVAACRSLLETRMGQAL